MAHVQLRKAHLPQGPAPWQLAMTMARVKVACWGSFSIGITIIHRFLRPIHQLLITLCDS